MKNKRAVTQVKLFIYALENSNFKYKCELLLFIRLILETGIQVSEIPSVKLIGDCEIEVLSTKRHGGKAYRAKIKKATEKLFYKTLGSDYLKDTQHYSVKFPSTLRVSRKAKLYFKESFLSLSQIRSICQEFWLKEIQKQYFNQEHILSQIAHKPELQKPKCLINHNSSDHKRGIKLWRK